MQNQIYLRGRIVGNPELSQTKKGRLWVKLLLETSVVREIRPGVLESESTSVPISFFARPAEQVKDLHSGEELMVGAYLNGTEFRNGDTVRHGVSVTADVVFIGKKGKAADP